jgi:hypothetical protein
VVQTYLTAVQQYGPHCVAVVKPADRETAAGNSKLVMCKKHMCNTCCVTGAWVL